MKFVHNAQYCFWDSWKMVPMNKKIVKQRIFVWCCAANCQDFLKHWILTWILKQNIIFSFTSFVIDTLESFIRVTLHNCWQIWCQHRKWILFCQNEVSRQPSQKCERILLLVVLVMGMFSTRTFINSSFWPFCWKTPVFVKNFNLVSNFL